MLKKKLIYDENKLIFITTEQTHLFLVISSVISLDLCQWNFAIFLLVRVIEKMEIKQKSSVFVLFLPLCQLLYE